MKRSILAIALAVSVSISILLASGNVRAEESKTTTISVGLSGYQFGTEYTVETTVGFNTDWIANHKPGEDNKELAYFSMVATSANYQEDKSVVVNLLENLGFSDVERKAVTSTDGIDEKDGADFVIAHIKDTFVTVFSSTGGEEADPWNSNFDMGLQSNSEDHPDWKNPLNHKGFDVSANRAKVAIDAYIEKHKSGDNYKILFTGHSRGGALANILGAVYKDNSYAYTFATPNTTRSKNPGAYTNIYNYINTKDIVTSIPPDTFGFSRFGKDYTFDSTTEPYKTLVSQYRTPAKNENAYYTNHICINYLVAVQQMLGLQDNAYANVNENGAIYRLYNPVNGEHLYTIDPNEKIALIAAGWTEEVGSWVSKDESGVPIYRLVNVNTLEHLYTADKNEYKVLVKSGGWNADNSGNPVFFGDQNGRIKVYRLYNPSAPAVSSHHYTSDKKEIDYLIKNGWEYDNMGREVYRLN